MHLGDHSVEHELSVYRVLGIVGEVFQEALASQNEQFFQSAVGIHLMYQRAIHCQFSPSSFSVVESVADIVVTVFVIIRPVGEFPQQTLVVRPVEESLVFVVRQTLFEQHFVYGVKVDVVLECALKRKEITPRVIFFKRELQVELTTYLHLRKIGIKQSVEITLTVGAMVVMDGFVCASYVLDGRERDRVDHSLDKTTGLLQDDVGDGGIFFLCLYLLVEHITQTVSLTTHRVKGLVVESRAEQSLLQELVEFRWVVFPIDINHHHLCRHEILRIVV